MTDTVVNIRDAKTGKLLPIKAASNGDGTYSFGSAAEVAALNSTLNSMIAKRGPQWLIQRFMSGIQKLGRFFR